MTPISTSKAAEEDNPEPVSTSEVMHASKPPILYPMEAILAYIPLTRAEDVFISSDLGESSSVSICSISKPSDLIRMILLSFGQQHAIMSRFTAAAIT